MDQRIGSVKDEQYHPTYQRASLPACPRTLLEVCVTCRAELEVEVKSFRGCVAQSQHELSTPDLACLAGMPGMARAQTSIVTRTNVDLGCVWGCLT